MQEQSRPTATEARVTGHVQVKGTIGRRKYYAHWTDRDGGKRTRTLGRAHAKDSGRRTPRGAVIWRAGDGPCPEGSVTPKMAHDALASILEDVRHAPRRPRDEAVTVDAVPTFGAAVQQWLKYLEIEKGRKRSTVQDARNVARAYLLPRFGEGSPLYSVERSEVNAIRGNRRYIESREDRSDTFTTEDVDDFRRDLLDSELSPRTVQKILVLLHGIFKLAKRRKLIQFNPSEDAERVTLEDAGTFNILEPVEFEAAYRTVIGEADARRPDERETDAIDKLSKGEKLMYGALLSTSFYAGLRMGEKRDLPWRGVDFGRELIRVESGYTHGGRSTPKGNRARSIPMVPVLACRLAALATRNDFIGESDYVFSNSTGGRVDDGKVREVLYAALVRAGLGQKRDKADLHGNEQAPMRIHDLRHSWCSWAVNVWDVTKVQKFAGHRDVKTTMRYVHHQTKAEDAGLGGVYLDRVLGGPTVMAHG
jgi:integrase